MADGYIPSDVSNVSTYAYPLLSNGCVDSGFNYTAPYSVGAGCRRAQMPGAFLTVLWVLGLGFGLGWIRLVISS